MIKESNNYRPFKLDMIIESDFNFYDKNLEENELEKKSVCEIIGNIKYLYFVDKYGVQWELQQGYADADSDINK